MMSCLESSSRSRTPRRWCAACTLALVAVGAQAQVEGSAWLDASQDSKIIYPTSAATARHPSAPSVTTHSVVQGETKTIWPKALSDSEREKVARRLLPLAFVPMSVPPEVASVGTAAGRATPLMLKTLMQAAERFGVDAYLIKAVIHAESAFNPRARSPKNAIGLMQVLPGTARDLGLSAQPRASVEQLLTDPRVSIVVGTKYLAEQLERFGGNVELAVAAYNAGPGAVIKAGNKIPPYAETRAYVKRVLGLARGYRQRKSLQGVQA